MRHDKLHQEVAALRQRIAELENIPYLYTEILQNKSRGGHFIRSSDGVFVYVNSIFEQMLGYEAGELIGKHISIINASTDQDSVTLANEIKQSIAETGAWQGQIQNIRKDGTIIWCDVIINEFDHHEFGTILLSVYQDITIRKQTETALYESEMRYRNVVQNQMELISHYNLDLEITFVNEAYCRTFGGSYDYFVGRDILTLIVSDYVDYVRNYVDQLTIDHPIATSEHPSLMPDGTYRWFQWHDKAIINDQNEIIEYQSVGRDITKQKQAEEKLLQKNILLQTLIDAIPDYIFAKDREGRFLISNQAHTNATRATSSDELIGKTANDVFSPALATQFHDDDDKVMSLNQPHINLERRSVDALGNDIWVSTTKVPLHDENQNIIGLVGISRDITERKQATQTIKRTESRFRMLIETASVAILIIDEAGIILTVNVMIEQLFGYQRGELVGQALEILLPESARAIHTHHRASYFANHTVRQMGLGLDLLGRRKDGSEFPVEIGLSFLTTDEGTQGVAFITDISYRKQHEADLQRYKNIISSTTDGIALINRDYIYDFANDAYIELTNSNHDNFEGQSIATIFGEKIFNTIIKPKIDQALAGNIVNYNEWFDLESNERKYIQVTYFPYLNKNEEIIGAVINARNITTIKQAEDERDTKQHIIASILSMIPDVINIYDLKNGNLVFGNTTMIEELGYTKSDILELGNDLITTIIHPDDLPEYYEHQKLFLQLPDDEILELEVRIKDKQDNWHWIYSRYTIFKRNLDGIPIEVLIISQDITDRKQLETIALENERLKTQFQKEHDQTEVIQRIISTLSHDMRTPLTVVLMARDMLDQYYDRLSKEKRKEKLNSIGHQIQFALQLLNDTVEVARGKQEFKPRLFNLAKLCEISLEQAHLDNNNNYQLIFKNIGNVSMVFMDEALVSRILLNLLSNAIKYSPDGGEIRIELDYYEAGIVLKVSDQGIGIAPENLPNIFDLLYRADNVKDISGTGLGLNIVKDCVERHSGMIDVQSELGKGSVFTIMLPFETEFEPLF